MHRGLVPVAPSLHELCMEDRNAKQCFTRGDRQLIDTNNTYQHLQQYHCFQLFGSDPGTDTSGSC